MILSAYAKLPKSSSRQRWHRHVRASSRCLASTTRESADQKQKWVYQLLCRSEDVANIIMPLYVITSSRSGFYGHRKKKLLQQVISDPEARELLELTDEGELVRVWSYETKSKLIWKHSSCLCTRTHVLLMGRPRLQDGKNIEEKEHSPPPLWWLHTESPSFGKDKRHNILTDALRFVLLLLAMVGNSWMGSTDQFATLSCRYFIRSHLVSRDCTDGRNNESSCSSLVTTTVTFLTKPIQMSSHLLGQW